MQLSNSGNPKALFFLAFFFIFSFQAQAQLDGFLIFDFDEVIINSNRYESLDKSELTKHGINTSFILKRISKTFVDERFQMQPTTIEIDPKTFYHLKDNEMLAKSEVAPGSIFEPFTLPDGQEILPGYYRIEPEITYQNYRKNTLLADAQKSESFPHSDGWKGPAYALFKAALVNPATRDYVAIVTARGAGILTFLSHLVDVGELATLPLENQIHEVNADSGIQSNFIFHDVADRKFEVIEYYMKKLHHLDSISDREDRKMVISPDGKKSGPYKSLHFFEDDTRYTRTVLKNSLTYTLGSFPSVKFVMHFLSPPRSYLLQSEEQGFSAHKKISLETIVPKSFVYFNKIERDLKKEEWFLEGLDPSQYPQEKKAWDNFRSKMKKIKKNLCIKVFAGDERIVIGRGK